jgi:hypothetical protein
VHRGTITGYGPPERLDGSAVGSPMQLGPCIRAMGWATSVQTSTVEIFLPIIFLPEKMGQDYFVAFDHQGFLRHHIA